jgi:hypothetical protein
MGLENIQMEFGELLIQQHTTEPFHSTNPRDNIKRVKDIAEEVGLMLVHMIGCIDMPGICATDYHWLLLKPIEAKSASVIDISSPWKDIDFREAYKDYIRGYIDEGHLSRVARSAEFEKRILPGSKIPKGMIFRGKSSFQEKVRVYQNLKPQN